MIGERPAWIGWKARTEGECGRAAAAIRSRLPRLLP
jgi:hypothetical protein